MVHVQQLRRVCLGENEGTVWFDKHTMSCLAQVGEEFFHPFYGSAPLVLSYVSLQFVVLEVCQGLNHEHCS